MTIEELLECDAATLEKMSDEELLKHFQKYLVVTRPELAAKQGGSKRESDNNNRRQPIVQHSPEMQKKLALLGSLGIDTSFASGKKRKTL